MGRGGYQAALAVVHPPRAGGHLLVLALAEDRHGRGRQALDDAGDAGFRAARAAVPERERGLKRERGRADRQRRPGERRVPTQMLHQMRRERGAARRGAPPRGAQRRMTPKVVATVAPGASFPSLGVPMAIATPISR